MYEHVCQVLTHWHRYKCIWMQTRTTDVFYSFHIISDGVKTGSTGFENWRSEISYARWVIEIRSNLMEMILDCWIRMSRKWLHMIIHFKVYLWCIVFVGNSPVCSVPDTHTWDPLVDPWQWDRIWNVELKLNKIWIIVLEF